MIESRIARRYLWSARKQAHTAFLSLISMLGLAVGVATLLISLALLTGLQDQIKGRLMASSPQLLIEPAGSNTIADSQPIIAEAQRLGMKTIEPVVSGIGWGANEDEKRGRPLRMRSFRPGHEPQSLSGTRTSPPSPDEPFIFVTREFAASVALDVGSELMVVAPRTRLTPFGPVPVWKKFRIARLVAPRSDEQAADAFIPESDAHDLFATGGRPTSIEMYGPPEASEPAQSQLAAKFPAVQVKTWKDINRPLFLALRLEKIVMFATISLIIFVAALNLISSLSMLIMEKRPQVGVLRTLGATEKTILAVFLQLGLLIGFTGTLLGNIFGIGISWIAEHYQLIRLPPTYFVSYLPFVLEPEDLIGVNVIAVLLSVLATWYPARLASRLDPIAAIRDEA